MRDLSGKSAFVTGAASGIGLALAEAFAMQGMRVMLADIEDQPLAAAATRLHNGGARVETVVCDVSNAGSVQAAARTAIDAFGRVHVVCNNAGVGGGSGIDDISLETWRWVLDVNLLGVFHGIQAFLPHIRAHGEGGHFVNTASMAGLQSKMGFSPYVASKYAVVGMSEGLHEELKPLGIGVSVLCPGFVRTAIVESRRNRPGRYGVVCVADPDSASGQMAARLAERTRNGMDPRDVAQHVLAAIRENDLYIFTHPEMRDEVEERFAAVAAAFNKAAART